MIRPEQFPQVNSLPDACDMRVAKRSMGNSIRFRLDFVAQIRSPKSFQFFDWLWRSRPLSYPRDLVKHLVAQYAYFDQNPNYDSDDGDESYELKQTPHESKTRVRVI